MKPFVCIAVIVLAGLLGFGLCATLDRWQDQAPPTWRAEQDSLRAEFANKSFQFDSLMAHTDSIRHYADSVQANRIHDTVYIPAVWRRVKLMDINAKMDSLKSL